MPAAAEDDPAPPPSPHARPAPPSAAPRVVPSRDLLAGAREVAIAHGGELYRLRLTAAGKLILTK